MHHGIAIHRYQDEDWQRLERAVEAKAPAPVAAPTRFGGLTLEDMRARTGHVAEHDFGAS